MELIPMRLIDVFKATLGRIFRNVVYDFKVPNRNLDQMQLERFVLQSEVCYKELFLELSFNKISPTSCN